MSSCSDSSSIVDWLNSSPPRGSEGMYDGYLTYADGRVLCMPGARGYWSSCQEEAETDMGEQQQQQQQEEEEEEEEEEKEKKEKEEE